MISLNRWTKTLRIFFVIAVLATTVAGPAMRARADSAGPEAVITWNAIAVRTILAPPTPQSPPASFVYASFTQAAVFNALVAIEGGYQPYKSDLEPNPEASIDAAVATAAHHVLLHYFPSQQAALEADYAASLSAIPDGPAETAGIDVGAQAAAELIALRQGDGLGANIGFTMPTPGPGVWQLPTGVNPLVPWMSKLRPFMLNSPDQFRPGPPPDLNSPEWARQYNEVLAYGRADSNVRTAEQTQIARFWSSVPLIQYNVAYQQISSARGLTALEAARLMAMGNMVGADALIGCFDAKYHYLFWRPVFAIAQGGTDGNPHTSPDPTFSPLLGVPAHPEYPSAHSCVTSAQAEVFAKFLGTQHIGVTIPSTVTGIPAQYYARANDLTQEIINARVWAGLHYRVSDVTGADLGRKVAHWTLKRYFLPGN
ncbi:MAG TPA: vanadium-dependent haloperoxidase [Anaerolineales bacterium]|nr:vanadium-dependent haloperoxidase [Anaerolineales bacterium]